MSDFLKEKSVTHFIPMCYKEKAMGDELKPKRVLVPVVHNYVFVEKTMATDELVRMLADCRTPLRLMKDRDSDKPSEVSNREMQEFRMLCDPAFNINPDFEVGLDDSQLGKEVEIVHGTFAGLRGRLFRKQKKYWFVKTVAGISVLLRISRWYCKPVNDDNQLKI